MSKKYTSIGGQALIEGIMMKSPEKTAMAVRKPDKTIEIIYLEDKNIKFYENIGFSPFSILSSISWTCLSLKP